MSTAYTAATTVGVGAGAAAGPAIGDGFACSELVTATVGEVEAGVDVGDGLAGAGGICCAGVADATGVGVGTGAGVAVAATDGGGFTDEASTTFWRRRSISAFSLASSSFSASV